MSTGEWSASTAIAMLSLAAGCIGANPGPASVEHFGGEPGDHAQGMSLTVDRSKSESSAASLPTEPPAFRELFAKPEVVLWTVQYASALAAAVTISGCEERATECMDAVILTHDNWKSESGFVLPDLGWGDFWTQALPGGAVAVVAKPGRHKAPLAPFIFHHTGQVTSLHLSSRPRNPRPGEILTSRPAAARRSEGEVWVLRRATAQLFPAAHQPCCRRGEDLYSLRTGRRGEVSALIQRFSARSVNRWAQLAMSHDHGRSWETHRNGLPDGFAAYAGGYVYFAAGPSSRLAAAWNSDPGTDSKRLRLFISDAGRSWQRIPAGRMPKLLSGMAFTQAGSLLLSAYPGETREAATRLWQLPPAASVPHPVSGAPRPHYGLQPACCSTVVTLPTSPVIAQTGPLSFHVSRGGKHWKAVEPGASLEAEPRQPAP